MRERRNPRHEQIVDAIEDQRRAGGWGDRAQLELDRLVGDAYEDQMTRGWDA